MAEKDSHTAELGGACFTDEEYGDEFERLKKALVAAAEQEAAAMIRKSRAEVIALGRALADGGHLTGVEIAGIIERERGT